jgi:hypothetical protein
VKASARNNSRNDSGSSVGVERVARAAVGWADKALPILHRHAGRSPRRPFSIVEGLEDQETGRSTT